MIPFNHLKIIFLKMIQFGHILTPFDHAFVIYDLIDHKIEKQ